MVCNAQVQGSATTPFYLIVPPQSVELDVDNSRFVWTVVNGKAHQQPVTTGDFEGDGIVILSGLKAGDQVIINGQQKVSEGMKVDTTKEITDKSGEKDMNQEIRQETNKPENSKKPEKDTALRDHIKARITRKPNRIIKRSFIESAMCNHNIVMLLMGMLVFLGILGICIMPKQEMPQFTIRQGACVAVYPGATSEEVEERVAKPLENFIFGYKEVNKKRPIPRARTAC